MKRKHLLNIITAISVCSAMLMQTVPIEARQRIDTGAGPVDSTIFGDQNTDTTNYGSWSEYMDEPSTSESAYRQNVSHIITNDWWEPSEMTEIHSTDTTKTWIKQGIDGKENYFCFEKWWDTLSDGGDGITYRPADGSAPSFDWDDLRYITSMGKNPTGFAGVQNFDPVSSSYLTDKDDYDWAIDIGILNSFHSEFDPDSNGLEWGRWQLNPDRMLDKISDYGFEPEDYNLLIESNMWTVDGPTATHHKDWYEHTQDPDIRWLSPEYTPGTINYVTTVEDEEYIENILEESDNWNLTAMTQKCLTDVTHNKVAITHFNDEYMWYIYNNRTNECVGCYFTKVPMLTITFPQGDANEYTIQQYQSYECRAYDEYKYKWRYYLFTDETLTCICAYESESVSTDFKDNPTSTQWKLTKSDDISTFSDGGTITVGNNTTPFNTQQIE